MRDMKINDLLREFNRFYLDNTLEEESAILGIGPERRFKREQLNELYKPIFLTLWVHVLDIHHKKESDAVRDAYLKGLKACYRRQKGEFERTMGLVIDYEAMLDDFSQERFALTAEQIVKKISRNKEAQPSRTVNLKQCMQKTMEELDSMVQDVRIVS